MKDECGAKHRSWPAPRVAILGLLLLGASAASAVPHIRYDIQGPFEQAPGELRWTYTYHLSGFAFEKYVSFFDIYFPETSYGIVEDPGANEVPPGWDYLVLPPDQNFPASSFSATGDSDAFSELPFTLRFEWLSDSTPGAQQFAIWGPDPATGDLAQLYSGLTSTEPPSSTPIPEPSSRALLFAALALLTLTPIRRCFERASACRR